MFNRRKSETKAATTNQAKPTTPATGSPKIDTSSKMHEFFTPVISLALDHMGAPIDATPSSKSGMNPKKTQ